MCWILRLIAFSKSFSKSDNFCSGNPYIKSILMFSKPAFWALFTADITSFARCILPIIFRILSLKVWQPKLNLFTPEDFNFCRYSKVIFSGLSSAVISVFLFVLNIFIKSWNSSGVSNDGVPPPKYNVLRISFYNFGGFLFSKHLNNSLFVQVLEMKQKSSIYI